MLKQPLVEEAAIPSISIDGSKEYRLENVYAKDLDRMVADCSAWGLLVQEGRATFQIKGNPIRYDRFGEEATSSYFRKRLRNPRTNWVFDSHEKKTGVITAALSRVGISRNAI